MNIDALYFAYGSNLHRTDWRTFCVRHGHDPEVISVIGLGYLPDFRPVYHYRSQSRGGGALDVIPARAHITPGMLFRVREEGWAALDRKEGAPAHYTRMAAAVLTGQGEFVEATTYSVVEARRSTEFVPPTKDYAALVTEGLVQHNLPTQAHLAAAAGHVPSFEVRHLFVYGMLQSVFGLSSSIPGTRGYVAASAEGRLVDLGAFASWQPAQQPDERVQGELIELGEPDEALRHTDRIEGCSGYGRDSLYHRVLISARANTGHSVRAWCYRYARSMSDMPQIDGQWLPSRPAKTT